ncbi:hypothetical protein ACFX59_17400 [Sphingomonas sp. NCPPB 2930]|uniref:rhamnosyltransferase WsaF family glycosyltransferase n=1 Tax=unclassified Sphingomonas TaxID=196159 RepID=UPI0028665FFA|nr:hypothetical protein [Sphingomonas sp. SORGH_AS_0870]MDR6144286.1 hypothetical protein [Sphingomonas sp. SORGH_AS_0870]
MINLHSLAAFPPPHWRRAMRQKVARWKAAQPRSVAALMQQAFHNLRPLKIRPESGHHHVTMITDSVAPGQLMGGVGTAVLLAVSIAQAQRRSLRIVTRELPCNDTALRALLELQGLSYNGEIDLIFSDGSESDPGVPLGPDDLVLTTSWWGTWSVRQTVPAHQIVYLLQEDERMFYAGGDQQLLCDETLNDTSIRYVVNSQLLLTHFQATDTAGPAQRGIAFEPAFPTTIYHPDSHEGRRNLVFYARPDHPRNLFLRGVAVLDKAFAAGLFPVDEWNVHFFGINIQKMIFPGRPVQYHNGLSWSDYASLIRQADLGFSLMYTPHPSYPPLDLAASGAVVVTNVFGPKGKDAHYSENILYKPLDIDALFDGLRQGVARVADDATRKAAHASARLNRDWATSFAPVLASLVDFSRS